MPAKKTITKSTLKEKERGFGVSPVDRPEPLKIFLAWKAPVRPFKKRSREYFTTIGAMVFLLMIILLFLQEWFLIIVMMALTFLAYIMATVAPQTTEHKITNRGIITGGKRYFWPQLGRFWFSEKWNQPMLKIENFAGLPRHLVLLIDHLEKRKIKEILSKYLLFEEPEKTWVDKASHWLSRRVPLESS